jgi:hypothetical protein
LTGIVVFIIGLFTKFIVFIGRAEKVLVGFTLIFIGAYVVEFVTLCDSDGLMVVKIDVGRMTVYVGKVVLGVLGRHDDDGVDFGFLVCLRRQPAEVKS